VHITPQGEERARQEQAPGPGHGWRRHRRHPRQGNVAHPSVGLKKKWAAERIALEAGGFRSASVPRIRNRAAACGPGRSARSRSPAHLIDRRTVLGDDGADRKPKEHAMTAPDATPTNGRYELPPHARGVLVRAARESSSAPARPVHPPDRSD
jgi:hypothetical protein